jgi:hypothetical protein
MSEIEKICTICLDRINDEYKKYDKCSCRVFYHIDCYEKMFSSLKMYCAICKKCEDDLEDNSIVNIDDLIVIEFHSNNVNSRGNQLLELLRTKSLTTQYYLNTIFRKYFINDKTTYKRIVREYSRELEYFIRIQANVYYDIRLRICEYIRTEIDKQLNFLEKLCSDGLKECR